MVRSSIPLSVHRKIVQASKQYNKLPADQKTGKNKYLQERCGHLSDSEDWESLIKRARKSVNEAQQKSKMLKAAKSHKKSLDIKRLQQDLDEEEIPTDIGGWVVRVVTWVHILGRVLPN